MIAEINAIETLLRSLGHRKPRVMPKIALRGRENLNLGAIRCAAKAWVGYWAIATERFSSQYRGRSVHEPRKGDRSETGRSVRGSPGTGARVGRVTRARRTTRRAKTARPTNSTGHRAGGYNVR